MKVTSVRLGVDLWRLLDREAALVGVSVSQYIREAALARAAAAAAARGEDPLELLSRSARERAGRQQSEAARDQAAERRGEAAALRAQSEQAARRTRALTAQLEQSIARAKRTAGQGEDRE